MSLPEPAPRSHVPIPPKPVPKPRPPIPSKPSHNGSDCPIVPKRVSSTKSLGKVKRIVHKFTEQESMAGGVTEGREPKRAPTVRPKPQRMLQMGGEKAPPLPLKMSRRGKKEEKKDDEVPGGGESVTVSVSVREEGGRSAPDGREVEVQVDGGVEAEAEAEQDLEVTPNPYCEKDCSCLCHLERPGMRLVWVPAEEEDEDVEGTGGEEENEAEQRGREGESETGEGEEEEEAEDEEDDEEEEEQVESGSSGGEEREDGQQDMAERVRFHQVLDIMMGEQTRRRSMETDVVVLTSYTPHLSHTPLPPSLPNTIVGEEEDSIYEATLQGVDVPLLKASPVPDAKTIPTIRLYKPPRREKASSSTDMALDPHTELESPLPQCMEDVPPAVPDRVPICKGASVPRGIPLPQPSREEWHAVRRSPPLQPPTDSCRSSSPLQQHRQPPSPLLPRRPPPQPPSPLLPHRASPQPPQPGPDGRRLSTQSLQSTPRTRDIDEDAWSDREREETMEEKPRAGPSREVSVDLKTQLLDEPLYQTYRATVIHKEIKRQTVCRNISKTSVDYQMDWGVRRGADQEGRRTSLGPTHSTLWQEMPSVRDSGILETLSPRQRQHQESMFEVLTSEASYLRSLRVLTDHFLESRDLHDTLIIRDKKTLFSNILRVREVSERFLKDLEERMEKSVIISDICDIIYYHAQHNFPAYIDYVRNQIYQEKTYSNLMKNIQFATVLARLQESPQCHRLPFMSFLLLPFQRITRIKMLIENILKRTQEGTKEEETASKALASVSKIIEECNSEVGKMKQMEELIYIAKTLEFDKLKAVPIISQNRFLEKQGELQEMAKGGTLFNIRSKFTPIFLFLFNDLLVLASKKSSERYVVMDHAHRSLVQVKTLDEVTPGPGFDHCFCLILLENHQGRMNERLLKAPTQSDMHRWMAAFPDPDDPERDVEEVVYEDWDCPQVQCIEQYIAQQADELNLEPTDIINVIRKANEGWYEGIRLSDGQKGWFPVGNVLEITNEHVRRRNLRERYRVIQAASSLALGLKSRTGP